MASVDSGASGGGGGGGGSGGGGGGGGPRVLTPEQRTIIDYLPHDGTKVVINSFAGCAKTTTSREIVKKHGTMLHGGLSVYHNQRADRRFLYLVFNRDAEATARRDFYERDKNNALVHVRTHHSLALKFFIDRLRARIKTRQPVGRGVALALAKIDRKIADLNGTLVSHVSSRDPALGRDELQTTSDEIDGYECDNLPLDECNGDGIDDARGGSNDCIDDDDSVEESLFSAIMPEHGGECARAGRALPLDLESDQLKPFGLERGDPALEVLETFCREANDAAVTDNNSVGGARGDDGAGCDEAPSAKHVAFLMPERDPTLPLLPVQRQVLARAQKAWRETICGRVNAKTGNLIIAHEATLKVFCAFRSDSEAFISQQYHTIIFDEAQDIDVILMHWIEHSQRFVCYLIGDACQSIYNFKGALNAMDHLTRGNNNNNNNNNGNNNGNSDLTGGSNAALHSRLKTFFLSQSFRFGTSVASIANAILERSGRFAALGCNARLSSAQSVPDTQIVYTCLPPQVKRQKLERALTRQETVAHYLAQLYASSDDRRLPLELTVIARKNNTLLTLAVELASQNVFVKLSGKLLDKLRHGALVLAHYQSLEHIDGRVDYLQKVLRAAQRENALAHMYRTIDADGDAARANGQTPWFHFVRPLAGCGEPTFSGVTSRICEQVLSELHVLQLALFMRDLYKMKTALAAILQNEQSDCGDKDSRRCCISLSTVHAAKGGEWDDVLVMDDFPDLCTLIYALCWCRGPSANLYRMTSFRGTDNASVRRRVEQELKRDILASVVGSSDRDEAIAYICRALASAQSFSEFVTSLDEELHLYYVAITRAKRRLHVGVLLQRFRNALATQ